MRWMKPCRKQLLGRRNPRSEKPMPQSFDVLMLDLNQTFMFGQDRFEPGEDFSLSYRKHGGHRLTKNALEVVIRSVYQTLDKKYHDSNYFEDFPSVADVLESDVAARNLDREDRLLVEKVIADHEIGTIGELEQDALRGLAEHTRLVLVSNIWSESQLWREYFDSLDLTGLFEAIVFSSDVGCIKPAPRIYQLALDAVDVSPSRVLFVGDDPVLDIEAPRSLGMQVCQIYQPHERSGAACGDVLPNIAALLARLS